MADENNEWLESDEAITAQFEEFNSRFHKLNTKVRAIVKRMNEINERPIAVNTTL